MSDHKLSLSRSASVSHQHELWVSTANEILFVLRLSLPDERGQEKVIHIVLDSLRGESYSRGSSIKLVVHPKLETHLVVFLPMTTITDSMSYHQHCCLVRAERPLTRFEVLYRLGQVCCFLDVPAVKEVEHVEFDEHAESGVYRPGDVLYGFYNQAEEQEQKVPASYECDAAFTDSPHEFSPVVPLPSPHSSVGSDDAVVLTRKPDATCLAFDQPPPNSLQLSFEKRTQEQNTTQIQNPGLQESEVSQSPILRRQLSYNDRYGVLKDENSKSSSLPTNPSSYTAPNPLPQPAASHNAADEFVRPTHANRAVRDSSIHSLVVGQAQSGANTDQERQHTQLSDKVSCSCGRTDGVHYLEAACEVPLHCEIKGYLYKPLVDSVAVSVSAIRMGMSPNNSEVIKDYIREHCDAGCSDTGCKIPHLYAGCALPIAAEQSPLNAVEPWMQSPQPANSGGPTGSCVTRQLVEKHAVERRTESEQEPPFALDARPVVTQYTPMPLRKDTPAPEQPAPIHDGADDQVEEPGFPKNIFNIERGKIIYKRKDMDAICPGDDFGYVPQPNGRNVLGKGGNGRVIRHVISNYHFALKLTKYRAGELDIWKSLRHPNIVPLLAVVAVDSRQCYQVMHQMTGTLKNELLETEYPCLLDLFNVNPEWKQALVMENVRYVIREVLQALQYLEEHNIKHGDIKMSNILVLCHCDCTSVFLCQCAHSKPSIKLADFDSAKKVVTASPESYHYYNDYPVTRKTTGECTRVLGTPGYRSPEQYLKPAPVIAQRHQNVDFDGPWCDRRALGVMVMVLFMGNSQIKNIYSKAWTMMGQPYRQDLDKSDPTFEAICTVLKELEMYKEYTCNPHIRSAAEFVTSCVQEDYRERPSASQLLESPFLQ